MIQYSVAECISCQKWVHRKCRVACVYKVMKTFVSRGCMIPVTGTGRISVDIGVNANLVLVDKFCYLGDMLSVDGDPDAAVENRIQIGWNKFRQLVPLLTTHMHTHTHTHTPLLTNKDISLKVTRGLYNGCV